MTAHLTSASDRPAILGGEPLFAEGPPEWPLDDPQIGEALAQAFADRSWGKYQADRCDQLCDRLKRYHQTEHVILCSSGTAAIELALRGLKVGAGDEVVLAAYDFKGNFQNVLAVGATPVLVDIAAKNWNLDVASLDGAVSEKSKAIVVSHLHGGVVDMPRVMEFALAHRLPVIEDACQMPGALVCGRRAGAWGDIGVLSFGGSKLLTSGRGGALFTNSADIAQRVKLHTFRGNEAYPLSELQAAVLLPQLERLDELNACRAEGVQYLRSQLAGFDGLSLLENALDDTIPGYYKLGLQYLPEKFDGLSRDQFAAAIRAEGVALDPGFRSLHLTHASRRFRPVGDLPNATDADERVLTLHHPVLLEARETLERVVDAIRRVRLHASEIREDGRALPAAND